VPTRCVRPLDRRSTGGICTTTRLEREGQVESEGEREEVEREGLVRERDGGSVWKCSFEMI
jgi:hypothetical protein